MILYHGSQEIIRNPVYGGGMPHNDYGSGFYCTEIADMGREWAVRKDQDGFLNSYEMDTDGLSVLDLLSDEYTILHWLTILIENRDFEVMSVLASEAKEYLAEHFRPDYDSFDLIIGYRADDSYFSFAKDFLNGTISFRQLRNAMYLGKLGTQVMLKSEKSFEKIAFTGYETVSSDEWFPLREKRDNAAREQYLDVERNRRQPGDIYITTILDEQMKPGDDRLRKGD